MLGTWLGINGIWVRLILADALTLGTMLAVIWGIRRRNPQPDRYLLDISEKGEGEISFSVRNTLAVIAVNMKPLRGLEYTGIAHHKTELESKHILDRSVTHHGMVWMSLT